MRYFTTTEAAAVLGVDPSRVRLLCKLGRIETIKIGNTYGIAEEVLEQFAATERRPGRPRKAVTQQSVAEMPVDHEPAPTVSIDVATDCRSAFLPVNFSHRSTMTSQ
jgi:excisionase family DNA binding protein